LGIVLVVVLVLDSVTPTLAIEDKDDDKDDF
jgi:hypothetical protein